MSGSGSAPPWAWTGRERKSTRTRSRSVSARCQARSWRASQRVCFVVGAGVASVGSVGDEARTVSGGINFDLLTAVLLAVIFTLTQGRLVCQGDSSIPEGDGPRMGAEGADWRGSEIL